jgi:hypothetical protein
LHAPRQLLVDGSGLYWNSAPTYERPPACCGCPEKGSCKNSNENCKALAMTIDHPVRIAGSSRH